MPTVQVLQREPDRSAEIIQSGMSKIANTIQENKKMKIYEAQISAMKRNADTEQEKLEAQRYENFVRDAHKLKELGGGQEALITLSQLYGSDTHPYLDRYAQDLSKFELKEDVDPYKQKSAEALDMWMKQQGAGQDRVPTAEVGVSADGQPDMNPRVGPMVGQTAQPREGRLPMTVKFGPSGASFEDPNQEVAVATAKKRAENLEDLKTGKMTMEEVNAVSAYPAAKSSINRILNKLTSKKYSTLQDVAIDAADPMFAGADIEEIQGAVNELKTQMPVLFGRGANFTAMEKRLLDTIVQFRGRTTGGLVRGLQFVNDFAKRRYDAITGGRQSVMQNETDFEMNEKLNAWVATAIEKGKSSKVIDDGIAQIKKQYGKE